MKVAILSLPLNLNCGGILQQYALKEAIKYLGHDAIILSRRRNQPFKKEILGRLKWFAISNVPLFGILKRNSLFALELFKRKYLRERVRDAYSSKQLLRRLLRFKCQAVVVGSDQVWNSEYAQPLSDYFLGFCNHLKLRRLSYAASFGHAMVKLSESNRNVLSEYIRSFDFVSVREKPGISFCKESLRRKDVLLMPDPTALLQKQDYLTIIRDSGFEYPIHGSFIFVYSLDITQAIIEAAHTLQQQYAKQVVFFYGDHIKCYHDCFGLNNLSSSVNSPSVENWLGCISSASLVLTDSFHGTLLSCKLNTPFFTFGNERRGMARFVTLLDQLSLSNRLISSDSFSSFGLSQMTIDWFDVNRKLEDMRLRGLGYLEDSLGLTMPASRSKFAIK